MRARFRGILCKLALKYNRTHTIAAVWHASLVELQATVGPRCVMSRMTAVWSIFLAIGAAFVVACGGSSVAIPRPRASAEPHTGR